MPSEVIYEVLYKQPLKHRAFLRMFKPCGRINTVTLKQHSLEGLVVEDLGFWPDEERVLSEILTAADNTDPIDIMKVFQETHVLSNHAH